MANEKARIAVIGTGWWSTTAHLPSLKANPDAELVAISDKRPETLANAAASFGPVKTYTDFREMLAQEKLDGVVVCVNHTAHYEVANACLEAGLPIMLDKPMVLKAQHAHDLLNTAKQRGVELIVGYPWNYTEITRRARDIVLSGELGAIEYVSCLFASMVVEFLRGNDQAYRPVFGYPVTGPGQAYSDPALSGGGQGHLQITHSAGALFFVTELQADRVSSFMENFDLAVDVVDAISVRFRPQNGRTAVGVLGSTANIGVGDGGRLEVQVFCERGYISLDESQGTLYIRKHDGREQRYGPLPAEQRYPQSQPSRNLVDIILGRGKNESPAEIGVRVVELLDAAYRSAAEDGKPFSVSEL
jgi:predicted dehydrogenase